MSILRGILMMLCLVPLLSGCNPDEICEDLKLYKLKICDEPEPDYFDVAISYNKMMRDPGLFCNYVGDNWSMFTQKFENCAVQHIHRLESRIDDTQTYCESIFIDPASQLWCDQKYGVGDLSGQVLWLTAMLEVTNQYGYCYLVNCDCALLGANLQFVVDLWNSEMPTGQTWQELMDGALPYYKKEFVCE